jgi:C-methyltransferase C-terminal domain/Putative zinc binding domain/Methyltransferase domain
VNVQAICLAQDVRRRAGSPCRLCGLPLEHTFVDLGMTPLCESFLAREELDTMEGYFPLHALVCEHCFLVQLKQYVSPEEIFRQYAYFSSYSSTWVAHAQAYCRMIKERLALNRDSLVVEVASNDGYLLQHFLPLDVPVLGIEPAANVARIAQEKGIPTRVEFLDAKLARELTATGQYADLIVGNNVLAQVTDLNDFVSGMVLLLKPEGLITVEFPHLQRLMEQTQFDTIYHEHFSYFSLITIDRLASRHGLKLIDVEELATHGGSLRVYLAHAESAQQPTRSVSDLLKREEQLGFRMMASYGSFATKVHRLKRDLLACLIAKKNAGKIICGYGAPGKGNTLLNYCGIGIDFLDFTVDRNPYKHGRFTPGMHVPIYPVEAIDAARPDFVLILPWNLKQEIVHQMRHIGEWGGQFIVPVPDVEIINPRELHS